MKITHPISRVFMLTVDFRKKNRGLRREEKSGRERVCDIIVEWGKERIY